MVMTFRQRMEYLDEVRRKNKNMSQHPHGTYVCANLNKQSKKALDYFVTEAQIPNPADPKQYHTTIIYSRKGVPNVSEYAFNTPFTAKPKEWKIFGTCLVLVVESDQLTKMHEDIMDKYGATYDYDDYTPHVTVSYNYAGPLPKVVPNIKLEYGSIEIEPLDDDTIPASKGD